MIWLIAGFAVWIGFSMWMGYDANKEQRHDDDEQG